MRGIKPITALFNAALHATIARRETRTFAYIASATNGAWYFRSGRIVGKPRSATAFDPRGLNRSRLKALAASIEAKACHFMTMKVCLAVTAMRDTSLHDLSAECDRH